MCPKKLIELQVSRALSVVTVDENRVRNWVMLVKLGVPPLVVMMVVLLRGEKSVAASWFSIVKFVIFRFCGRELYHFIIQNS